MEAFRAASVNCFGGHWPTGGYSIAESTRGHPIGDPDPSEMFFSVCRKQNLCGLRFTLGRRDCQSGLRTRLSTFSSITSQSRKTIYSTCGESIAFSCTRPPSAMPPPWPVNEALDKPRKSSLWLKAEAQTRLVECGIRIMNQDCDQVL